LGFFYGRSKKLRKRLIAPVQLIINIWRVI